MVEYNMLKSLFYLIFAVECINSVLLCLILMLVCIFLVMFKRPY